MQVFSLDSMKGGWFVGDFEPTVLRSAACEVAVKRYAAGDLEPGHVHRVAVELTLVAAGRARMNGVVLEAGDIARLDPGEAAVFEVLEDTTTVVVKLPSVRGDKYPVA